MYLEKSLTVNVGACGALPEDMSHEFRQTGEAAPASRHMIVLISPLLLTGRFRVFSGSIKAVACCKAVDIGVMLPSSVRGFVGATAWRGSLFQLVAVVTAIDELAYDISVNSNLNP